MGTALGACRSAVPPLLTLMSHIQGACGVAPPCLSRQALRSARLAEHPCARLPAPRMSRREAGAALPGARRGLPCQARGGGCLARREPALAPALGLALAPIDITLELNFSEACARTHTHKGFFSFLSFLALSPFLACFLSLARALSLSHTQTHTTHTHTYTHIHTHTHTCTHTHTHTHYRKF